MPETLISVDRCRVCGADDWLDVISFGSAPLANGFLEPAARYAPEPAYPLDVVVCRRCWLMSLRHVVDPEVLFGDYVYLSSGSDLMRRHMRHVADRCGQRLAPGDLVVELGSNIGTQLEVFAERGMRTVGVDPARNLARVANDRGVATLPDFFGPRAASAIAGDHGAAALVLGRQCFAHIHDVHHVLDGVGTVLAPDGTLVIEVPYLADLLEDNQFDTIYHEHLSYFSLGTLVRLFAAHDLRVTDVERVDVHGGSILVFAQRVSAGGRGRPSVDALLDLERERGLYTERAYRAFADRAREVTTSVRDLVRDLVAEGHRVAGYGAPSKGCALLMACGLDAAEIEFCSDTTVLKHGTVMPGTHIPVCSPEQAKDKPPDYYLLLAWNYATEIIRKERAFLEGGGRFIVPIPEPRVVTAQQAVTGDSRLA